MQFDFSEPNNALGSTISVGYGVDTNDFGNSTNSRIRVTLDDGVIGNVSGGTSNTYTQGIAYTFYLIFNDTASAVNYEGGWLAAHTADLYFKEIGAASSAVYAGNISTNAAAASTGYYGALRTYNSATQEVWIDNYSIYEGAAAIPEPKVVLLVGIGLLAQLRRRR